MAHTHDRNGGDATKASKWAPNFQVLLRTPQPHPPNTPPKRTPQTHPQKLGGPRPFWGFVQVFPGKLVGRVNGPGGGEFVGRFCGPSFRTLFLRLVFRGRSL